MSLPKVYHCRRTTGAIVVDGIFDEAAWSAAAWTDDFVDIEGDIRPAPRYRTRAKMLWDETYFYFGFELEEPHVSANLTEHDSVIFHDNDIEIFIDPDGDAELYVELEINALNTTWDLLLVKAYRDGGPAIDGFELHGLQTAVHVHGTLNDPSDRDTGWTVEVAIPWRALKDIARMPLPPKPGDRWRVNFSRVEWLYDVVDGKYVKCPETKEDNWVWSPQGIVDMHQPEHWGFVEFVE
jgi:hypothetical protein